LNFFSEVTCLIRPLFLCPKGDLLIQVIVLQSILPETGGWYDLFLHSRYISFTLQAIIMPFGMSESK
jgi:hypothetical protein